MMQRGKDTIQNLSLEFAMDIVNICKKLISEKHEFIMSKQLLKSGMSIGANVREAQNAESSAKLSISLKEAGETE